ncbi:MAG: hypothetical protein M1501_03870 [Candidatus Omnitrophica bacterium]|nr:hypothetical protein [Candidatus Omnitrophota bacterium]
MKNDIIIFASIIFITFFSILLPVKNLYSSPVNRSFSSPPDYFQAEAHFRYLQLRDSNGLVKPNGYIQGVAERAAMVNRQEKAASALGLSQSQIIWQNAGISNLSWVSLGPNNIGGRIRSIWIDPQNSNHILVGSVGGGLWVSSNAGASWNPVNDFLPNLSICTIAQNPVNGYLYAGTGEGFYNGDAIRGYGIFYSTDNGSTWQLLPSTNPTNNSDWYFVNRIAISPDGTTMLAATGGYATGESTFVTGGIYRSTNGGSTWTEVATGRSLDVAFDPNNSSNAVADIDDPYNTGTVAIEYSTNGGQTWTVSNLGTPMYGRAELSYAKSTSNLVYASYDNTNNQSVINGQKMDGDIYKSTDGGQTWTYISTPDHLSQGWYANTIWVSPTNSNHLVIGGLNLWQSTDGGNTWTQISDWTNTPTSPHADHHVIISDPGYNGSTDRKVYFGDDGGLYFANDVTAVTTTSGWTELNNGLAITQFYSVAGHSTAVAAQNNNITPIIGGAQDNGSLLYSGSPAWTAFFGGDGGDTAVDTADGDYLYGEYVYLDIFRSTDGGATQASELTNEPGDTFSNANFIAPFILDPNNNNTMLAGGTSLWLSQNIKNSTPTWTSINGSTLPTSSDISAIAVAYGNSNDIWVGHNDGTVYRMTGTINTPTWQQVGGGSFPAQMVLSIFIAPNNSNQVYVTFGGYTSDNIWVTADNGNTWTDIDPNSSGLPQVPVYSITTNPSNSQWLYIGTDAGIFDSTDGGTIWNATNDGPANVCVEQLAWFNNSTLLASTHGRGVFSISLTYTVTASVNGGNGTVSPATQNVTAGNSASITITPNTGYGISSITDNGTSEPITNSSGETYTINNVTANHTVVVAFATAYTVTASVSGGNGTVSPATQSVVSGGSASITITPNTGYQISSITDNGTSMLIANPYVINNVVTNHTVVVTFSIITWTINASVNGGNGTVSPATQTVNYGSSASITITPNAGYGISSITDNGTSEPITNSSGETYTINNVTANHTVVINFAPLYTVTASVNGGNGTVSPATQSVVSGSSASITITPNPGYGIQTITDNGTSMPVINPYIINNVTTNHTVVINFAPLYTVTASVSGGNGTVSPATQNVTAGNSASITIMPNTGYGISSITDNGTSEPITNSSGETYTINNVTANHTVVVTFSIITLTVNASINGGNGTVSPVTQTVNYGSSASITITPNTGYQLAGITDNGMSVPVVNPYVINNVTINHTIVVTFAQLSLTVTAGQNEVTLQWITDFTGIDSFIIMRKHPTPANPNPSFTAITTLPSTNKTFVDSGYNIASGNYLGSGYFSDGRPYYYQVVAFSSTNSETSNVASAIPSDFPAGQNPANLQFLPGYNGFTVTWTNNTSTDTAYYIEIWDNNIPSDITNPDSIITIPGTSTTGLMSHTVSVTSSGPWYTRIIAQGSHGFSLYATASNGQDYSGGNVFGNLLSVKFSGGGGTPVGPLTILLVAILMLIKFIFNVKIIKKHEKNNL